MSAQPNADQGIFDRDPCDGCDGTCDDVCPVLEAQRQAYERIRPAPLPGGHLAVCAERDRIQAENERLRTALGRIAAIAVDGPMAMTPAHSRLSNAVAIAYAALSPAPDEVRS